MSQSHCCLVYCSLIFRRNSSRASSNLRMMQIAIRVVVKAVMGKIGERTNPHMDLRQNRTRES